MYFRLRGCLRYLYTPPDFAQSAWASGRAVFDMNKNQAFDMSPLEHLFHETHWWISKAAMFTQHAEQ